MAERKTYAVSLGNGKWGRTRSLKLAKKAIDEHGGGEIRSMPLSSGKGSWDWPTFYVSSDPVPYTPKVKRVKRKGVSITPKRPGIGR